MIFILLSIWKMRNFKTTKWAKAVIDFQDWYYTWEEVREYYALDELKWYIVLSDKLSDLRWIHDLELSDEWLEYLLWRQTPNSYEPDKYDEEELKRLKSHYGYMEDDYEIRPFYISYYGSGQYRVQFCEWHEWQWIMFISRKQDRKEMDNAERMTKLCFEHYIEGDFYYVQLYSWHTAQFDEQYMKDNLKKYIVYYDFEDWWTFFLTEKDARDSINTEQRGEIIESTESEHFEPFELVDN